MNRLTYPGDPIPARPRAVALGFFDGVHLGHRAVLQAAFSAAAEEELTPAVFTFDSLPKGGEPLYSRQENGALLAAAGMEELFVARFQAVKHLSPAAFADLLFRDLSVRTVCCGEDFRFGAGRAGDVPLLKTLCRERGIRLIPVPAVTVEGEPVSTTRIRQRLAEGDIPAVNRMLGRPYTLAAPVATGRGLGHTLGTPTLNQPLPEGTALPRFGVYVSAVTAEGRTRVWVTNIGIKPTVGGSVPLAETWIPGFSGDLYGQKVPVSPVAFLRPERRFDSLEDLKAQIAADGARALQFPADPRRRAVLFDFDGALQDRTRSPLHTVLLPGTAEGLARLRAAGWLVGAVTNGDSLMQNRKLDASGLRPLLDTALVSGDEGVRMSDPELFRRAAARLGVDPARCVFVGDHPMNGMEGAAAAGMRPVFMEAGGVFPPPRGVERVSCMAELVALLEGGETL